MCAEDEWKSFWGRRLEESKTKCLPLTSSKSAVRGRRGEKVRNSFRDGNYCSKGFRVFKPLRI